MWSLAWDSFQPQDFPYFWGVTSGILSGVFLEFTVEVSLQNPPNPNQPLLLSSRGPAAQWPPLYQSFTNIGAEIAAAVSFPQTGQTATQTHGAPQPRFIQRGPANSRGSPLRCELRRWNLRNSLHFWVKAYMRRVE